MTFLLDTMVISERSKSRPHAQAIEWLESTDIEKAFLSVVTIGEIERGIRKFEFREGHSTEHHRSWLTTTVSIFGSRVLPITMEIARRWGRLSFDLKNTNPDLMIAATALEHDLTIVTRNIRHFEPTGAKLLNPYET